MKTILFVVTASLLVPCSSWSLRASRGHLADREEPAEIATPAEINAKWDKMDDFLGIMFKMACNWKHGKDVAGAAHEELKAGKLDGDEVTTFKEAIQSANLEQITQACGKLTATGKEKCRMSCQTRWGEAMVQRDACDEKCVTLYNQFDKDCSAKAENLQKVYEMKLRDADARKACYEGHCAKHPTVWMKDAAYMAAERDTQCEASCTEERITIGCERRWAAEVDFERTKITSSCFSEGEVTQCFEEKKTAAGSAQDACSTDGKGECGTQYDTCVAEGKVDQTFSSAKEFCEHRKTLCMEQVADNCNIAHEKALSVAKKECEAGDTDALKTCTSDKIAAAETDAMTACKEEHGPSCVSDCKKNCDVEAMGTCMGNLKSENNPGEDFCEDFWNLLHSSSEIDPVTGDPVVLLAE